MREIVIREQEALRLRAKQKLSDKYKIERKTGEEYLIREPGSYLPSVY